MVEQIIFHYDKEFWFISSFINTNKLDIDSKIHEIEDLLSNKIKNLSDTDLKKISWNKDLVKEIIKLGKDISIKCEWCKLIDEFPYFDEDKSLIFNELGYIKVEVEYYKGKNENKKSIKPSYLQQIPSICLEELKIFSKKYVNQYISVDLESPIYIFAVSGSCSDAKIQWTKENIEKNKKEIGSWTEIYSGQWPDYTEDLYNERIMGNLSNRLSELHYIRRNSGFIFMHPEGYKMFFGYMNDFVITPTAKIRSLIFSLLSINESLDVLYRSLNANYSIDLTMLEIKIRNLRNLRGLIQTEMSKIQNELDYNRRPHYTKVLKSLIYEFDLNSMLDRISKKFDLIFDSMLLLYQQKNEENQKKQNESMKFLQKFFGLNVIVGVFSILDAAIIALGNGLYGSAFIKFIPVVIIFSVFAIGIINWLKFIKQDKKPQDINTADAVIIDENNKIILITRKFPPFKGQLALPGGFIELGETPEQAVIREVKEEISIDVEIIKEIGIYDKKGRDPRGNITTKAFLCKPISDLSQIKGKDDAMDVNLYPVNSLKGIDLAFDHEDILKDALNMD